VAEAEPTPTSTRRRWPRRLALVLIAVGLLTLLSLALVGISLLPLRGDLGAARTALIDGRRALSFGNVEEATGRFEDARRRFEGSAAATDEGLAGIARMIPILGNNVRAVQDLAEAGAHLSEGGLDLTAAIGGLPDGLGSLAPEGGGLPLEAMEGLAEPMAAAADQAETADRLVSDSPSAGLLGPISEARSEAQVQAAEASRILRAGSALVRGFPVFAGGQGPKRYLFVAENPAELRGTGGLWGAYSIATFEDGELSFGPFLPIQSLTDLPPGSVEPPNPDYERNYDQYGGASYWLNLNMTPDFPSASRAALSTYEATEGEALDGVIAADPFALEAMMAITGPTRVPGYGVTIDADSVVDFTTNGAYRTFGRRSQLRKDVLGEVAKDVFEEFLGMEEHRVGRLRALAGAAADGHVKVYSTDPTMQEGLRLAGADASLAVPRGDLLAVSANSGSGTKIDFYARRTVSYDVQLGGEGEAIATTKIQLANDAPSEGEPRYIIGPNLADATAGDQVTILTVFCAERCALIRAVRDGERIELRVGSELGYQWYQDYLTVPSGETSNLRVETKLDSVWEGNSSGGSYRLTLLNQSTIKPTRQRVAIHAPSGTNITWTSEPMEVDGGTAVWEGIPGPRLDLVVRFSAPLPLRLWRDVIRPLP
jgi:hypothetical protein